VEVAVVHTVIHSGEKVGRSVDNLYEVDAGTTGDETGGAVAATGLSLILQGKRGYAIPRTAVPTRCAQAPLLRLHVVDNV
jgi:hypothetical protein